MRSDFRREVERFRIEGVHILYTDESGSTGPQLADEEQPIFAMAGLIISDEKWRKTSAEVQRVVSEALGGSLPQGFELHAADLLAPEGQSHFKGLARNARCALALKLLRLIDERKHQVVAQVYDKKVLANETVPPPSSGFPWSDPWELAFALMLTMFEEFLRGPSTGRSSSGLVVIDHEERYLGFVRDHSRNRINGKGWRQTKKVVEIGYSAVSHANPMIQLADLVAFVLRKYAEVQAGYREDWSNDAKQFFKDGKDIIWPRLLFKGLSFPKIGPPAELITYAKKIRAI